MQQVSHVTTPRKNRRVFCFAAIFLLLGAIVAVMIQKQHESAVAIAAATGDREKAQHLIQDAWHWEMVGLTTVVFAILSCGIALWRHEKHRRMWVPVTVLLFLYVCLQLLMV